MYCCNLYVFLPGPCRFGGHAFPLPWEDVRIMLLVLCSRFGIARCVAVPGQVPWNSTTQSIIPGRSFRTATVHNAQACLRIVAVLHDPLLLLGCLEDTGMYGQQNRQWS